NVVLEPLAPQINRFGMHGYGMNLPLFWTRQSQAWRSDGGRTRGGRRRRCGRDFGAQELQPRARGKWCASGNRLEAGHAIDRYGKIDVLPLDDRTDHDTESTGLRIDTY